jgi:hypothetical protein
VHLAAAARAVQAVGLDDPLYPGQILGHVAVVSPNRGRRAARCVIGRYPAVAPLFDLDHRDLEVFEGQLPLVRVELLGLLAMHHMVQLDA